MKAVAQSVMKYMIFLVRSSCTTSCCVLKFTQSQTSAFTLIHNLHDLSQGRVNKKEQFPDHVNSQI